MKGRKFFICLIVSLFILAGSNTPTSAANSSVKDSTSDFITEQDAKSIAIDLIKSGGAKGFIKGWNWNNSTKIESEVPLFDYDGNINSYLFRLNTNGLSQGYIFINTTRAVSGIESFSDVGNHPVDIMARKQIGHNIKEADSVINAGLLNYSVKESDKYINLETGDQLSSNIDKLKSSYKNLLSEVNSKQKVIKQIDIDASLPSADSLDNISHWNSPYVTSDFGDKNNCTPTALTNFVYYWSHFHPNKKTDLWTGTVYSDLKSYVWWTSIGGSPNFRVIPALTMFGESRNTPIVGSDYRSGDSIDWNFIAHAIYTNIPVVLNTKKDPYYKYHSVVAVGFKHSSQPFLQIINGWESTIHTVYPYENAAYLDLASYVRWA